MKQRAGRTSGWLLMSMFTLAWAPMLAAQTGPPAPPTNVVASDHSLDGGHKIDVTWELSPEDPARVAAYRIYRSMTEAEVVRANSEELRKGELAARDRVTAEMLQQAGLDADAFLDAPAALKERIRAARQAAAEAAAAEIQSEQAARSGQTQFMFLTNAFFGETSYTADKLELGYPYEFQVESFHPQHGASRAVRTTQAVAPVRQWLDGTRIWVGIITLILCGAVVYWINHARKGRPIKVRKIAGLEAVDEAVGRATEMGRSCLFVPGIQDMNDIQTIAGITILARVAKTAAEYDAKVEVPTSRSLVMTTARETVQSSFLAAGRPDAYNEDLIYYVTDEQFGYVAYLSGMMVREKPAACFYMGSFFAESLILAETGNSIGAIQVAGTAQPAQLPFFVAACDYTLIGEEFFAASAYLSGSPEEMGSLKGQDVGKLVVAFGMIVGIFFATAFSITDSQAMADIVDFIKNTMLT